MGIIDVIVLVAIAAVVGFVIGCFVMVFDDMHTKSVAEKRKRDQEITEAIELLRDFEGILKPGTPFSGVGVRYNHSKVINELKSQVDILKFRVGEIEKKKSKK